MASMGEGRKPGASQREQLSRAERFPIETIIHYRQLGETRWHKGRTRNISASGVLFQGKHVLEVKTPVEMRFVLPVEVSALKEPGGQVICGGQIVRWEAPVLPRRLPAFAATIAKYRLMRRDNLPDLLHVV